MPRILDNIEKSLLPALHEFFHPATELCLPVYLEPDLAEFMQKLAGQKDTDVEKLVNDWLRRNIGLIETIQQ